VPRLHPLAEVLSSPGFRRLYGTRLIGQFGDGLLQASLATFVLFSPEREPSAAKVAAAFAILLLPYSIIGPFAGVFLDRWHRRGVLVWANGLKALLTVPVIVLVLSLNDGPLLGISVLALLGTGRFVLAALSASLPHVVSGRDLVTANALSPTSGTIASAIGALLGVGLRSLAGGGDGGSAVILVCALLAFAAAGLLARGFARAQLGPSGDEQAQRESVRGVLAGLIDGIRTLRTHAAAGRAIAVVGVHRIAFGALTAGALLLLRNTFNPIVDADSALGEFAIVTGAAALGALIAAIITPAASRRWSAPAWSAAALVQAGVLGLGCFILGSQSVSFPLLLVAGASLGFAGQAVKVCSDTIVQASVPDDHLGRVFTLFDMIVNVCLVAGIGYIALVVPASGQAPLAYALLALLLVGAAGWYVRRAATAVD